MIVRVAALFTAVVLTVVLAGGCGGAAKTTPVEGATTSQATTPSATAPQTGQTQTTSSAPGSSTPTEGVPIGTVPNEVGVRLEVARRSLQAKGIPFRVLARGAAGMRVKGDWTICEVNPAPRTHLESGTTVDLIVAPTCH